MVLKKVYPVIFTGLILFIAGCSFFAKPAADIKLPVIFSSNMVLQQGIKIPFWGTAVPGGKVIVIIDKQKKSVVVPKEGKWRIDLPPREVGGPHTIQVIGQDTITYENVMIGEVWVCSGQSNMEMPIAGWGEINKFEEEIANANYPDIRLFTVQRAMSVKPLDDIDSTTWQICSPQAIPLFSATAYFFGRHLNQTLDIPVGLIHTSWGGTPAEAWTSAASLRQLEDYTAIVDSMQTGTDTMEQLVQEYQQKLARWQKMLDDKIKAAQGSSPNWESPTLDTKNWKYMNLPVLWEKAGLPGYDGLVWFRKEFTVPESMQGKDLLLHLGPIDDSDITWFNGTKVGQIDQYNEPRNYKIPASLAKPGKNVLAVQILDTGGGGGIWGNPADMKLEVEGGKSISLSGIWKYKPAMELQALPPRPQSPESANRPTVLYNAMIHPLIPYGIRGAIWYQGEANAGRAYQYRSLFKTMIQDWRTNWALGDFPFLFTQLANFMQVNPQPADNDWAELREAQLMALSLHNTGMAVTIDIGNADDIHPKNKQDVGKRLALNALNKVYDKQDVVPCGPIYKFMVIEENKIRLSFDYVAGGLSAKGDKLLGFAIAGEDQKFVWADAEIDSQTVVVSSPYVNQPVAVRYAWAANPVCNMYNKADLPATPFRTDDWSGITVDNK